MDRWHDWNLFFLLMIAVYLCGAMCWPFIDPVTPIEEAEDKLTSQDPRCKTASGCEWGALQQAWSSIKRAAW